MMIPLFLSFQRRSFRIKSSSWRGGGGGGGRGGRGATAAAEEAKKAAPLKSCR